MLSVATHAEERHLQRGQVDAFVWIPDADAAARWPVVVFSHGHGNAGEQEKKISTRHPRERLGEVRRLRAEGCLRRPLRRTPGRKERKEY
jgi:hypothetical protein